MSSETHSPLVWITHNYALNPAAIAVVFHGHGGQVEISFLGGAQTKVQERELTPAGRALLLPPPDVQAHQAAAMPHAGALRPLA